MFGIGFTEFIVIGLAILIFVKPKDFPKFLRKMGILYGNLRRTYDETMQYFQDLTHLEEDTAGEERDPSPLKKEGSHTQSHTRKAEAASPPGSVSRKDNVSSRGKSRGSSTLTKKRKVSPSQVSQSHKQKQKSAPIKKAKLSQQTSLKAKRSTKNRRQPKT